MATDTVKFPVLYRKSGERIRIWEIYVDKSTIVIDQGLAGGKMQESEEVIKAGKNIGQSNETTPHEQAVSEARSRWQKKKDKGYVESLEAAEAGEDQIEGGYFPMLAKKYESEKFGGPYPVFYQPKLDGLRATNDNGRLFSRTRKPFRDFPHIRSALISLGLENTPLDGELYSHELRGNFEEIVSAIKRGSSDHPLLPYIEFHVYDVHFKDTPFFARHDWLKSRVPLLGCPVKLVPTGELYTREEVALYHDSYVQQGYEGLMLRDPRSEYLSDASRRSNGLLKVKMFSDDEFEILDIKEGRGKLAGHVGAFVCKYKDETFDAKLEGREEFLKQCFEDHSLWRGKWLTVKYHGFTNKKVVPRFPIGLRIRETE